MRTPGEFQDAFYLAIGLGKSFDPMERLRNQMPNFGAIGFLSVAIVDEESGLSLTSKFLAPNSQFEREPGVINAIILKTGFGLT